MSVAGIQSPLLGVKSTAKGNADQFFCVICCVGHNAPQEEAWWQVPTDWANSPSGRFKIDLFERFCPEGQVPRPRLSHSCISLLRLYYVFGSLRPRSFNKRGVSGYNVSLFRPIAATNAPQPACRSSADPSVARSQRGSLRLLSQLLGPQNPLRTIFSFLEDRLRNPQAF